MCVWRRGRRSGPYIGEVFDNALSCSIFIFPGELHATCYTTTLFLEDNADMIFFNFFPALRRLIFWRLYMWRNGTGQ